MHQHHHKEHYSEMQLILDFPLNQQFGFSNFVVCSGNETAFKFSQRVASRNAEESLLYLHGPAGAGKTHLLEACSRTLGEQTENVSLLPVFSFKETPGLAPQAIISVLHRRFDDSPALLIDDIHLAPPDQHLKTALWQLFNDFHGTSKPIVITGLNSPKELANLDDHLASRLLWGLVARVDVSDDSSRRMIMQKLASDRQVILPEDVTEFLIRHLSRDIPTLIYSLDRIVRHSLSTGRKLSPKLAAEALASTGYLT